MNDDRWIDQNIIIDFAVPRDIGELMDECERLDAAGSGAYYNYAETMCFLCKEAYVRGHLTKAQWDAIERRYLGG